MDTKIESFVRRTGCFLILLLVSAVRTAGQERVVAVADVHGAYPEFVAILQRTGLIDANRQWIGGSSVLVQTGDVLDRGKRARECLDLIMELERQAKKQNGRVVPLLGNHEVMNLMGDLRYVVPEDYRAFSTEQSEKRRDEAYHEYRRFVSEHSAHHHTVYSDDEAGRQKWMADHPLGFFERHDAFDPLGMYGRWVRDHDAVLQLGDVLFVHGGLNPKMEFKNIKELNERVRSEIAVFDSLWQSLCAKKIIWRYMKLDEATRQVQEEWMWMQARGQVEDPEAAELMHRLLGLQNWLILSPEGPIWYRGLALEPEANLKSAVAAMLARLKVRYLVAGHTVQPKSDIVPRFDNRVFLIDTGMLPEAYGGRASALEIRDGVITAYYSDLEPKVLVRPALGTTSAAPGRDKGEEKQSP
jgi:hypothetical protein